MNKKCFVGLALVALFFAAPAVACVGPGGDCSYPQQGGGCCGQPDYACVLHGNSYSCERNPGCAHRGESCESKRCCIGSCKVVDIHTGWTCAGGIDLDMFEENLNVNWPENRVNDSCGLER